MAESFGFPTWTLWGMGLAAFGALITIALAFLAQSPRLLARFKLTGWRLDLRAKSYTGYGLALLLLAMGFFLAGVPLGPRAATTAGELTPGATEPAGLAEATTSAENALSGGQTGAMVGLPTSDGLATSGGLPTPTAGGASGAMAGLITPQPTLAASDLISGTAEIDLPPGATTEQPAPTTAPAEPTPTRTATPTRVPTATATLPPSPTPTATPILGPTARINDGTSTLPVRRLPGGPVLVVLVRGDTVIPLSGHAFYDGDLWREIQTVDGIIGWTPDEFLDYSDE